MPQRTNLFQQTIPMVHEHLAGDATVEESAMLPQRTTGELREVDVVIRSLVAGHEVVVSVEARAASRKADLPWVESMIAKHADLPTSQLVLVSESGFTAPAKRQAEAKGALAIAPEDLAGNHPGRELMERLARFESRELTLRISHMIIKVRPPSDETTQVRVPHSVNLYTGSGDYLMMLIQLFESERHANFGQFVDAVGAPAGNKGEQVELTATLEPPWTLPGDLVLDEIYAQFQDADPPELHLIEEVKVLAEAAVTDVPPVEMTPRQLGPVAYAYGETMFGGEPALVVVTADAEGARVSMRLRRP